jgi:hypothetical protein
MESYCSKYNGKISYLISWLQLVFYAYCGGNVEDAIAIDDIVVGSTIPTTTIPPPTTPLPGGILPYNILYMNSNYNHVSFYTYSV